MSKPILLLFLMIAAISWGRAEEPKMIISPSNGTIAAALKEGKRQTFILYGTSLTVSGAWGPAIQNWLKEKTGDKINFINSAEGAKNSQWGLENLEDRILKHKPDYVLIEFGMNDAYVPYHTSLSQVQKQIEEMIAMIRGSNPSVGIGFMSMNPQIEDAEKPVCSGSRHYIDAYYELYRKAAIKHQLDYIDHYQTWIEQETKDPGFLKRHIEDGVHPDPESVLLVTFENLKVFLTEKLK